MAKYASESWSNSKSQTWEGIEGYKPQWIDKKDVKTKLDPVRQKQDPKKMSKEDFGRLYGFVYGDDIDKAYESAMNAKYDELDSYTRMARDTSLQDMSNSHDQYLQTLRDQRAKSPQTGIAKGSSMAAELQGMFGSQNQMVESQQQYQQQMAKLAAERGTAAEQARINALTEKNKVASQMGSIGSDMYGYDVQNEASYLSYLGQMGQNQAAMLQAAGVWNQAEGQNTRRKTSESTSSSYSYDDSANIAAQAQRYAADRAASAQRYASDKSASAAQNNPAFDAAVAAYRKKGMSQEDAVLAALGLGGGGAPGSGGKTPAGNKPISAPKNTNPVKGPLTVNPKNNIWGGLAPSSGIIENEGYDPMDRVHKKYKY